MCPGVPCQVDIAVKIQPSEHAVFIEHISVVAVFLRNRRGAGVEAGIANGARLGMMMADGNVSVPLEENVPIGTGVADGSR